MFIFFSFLWRERIKWTATTVSWCLAHRVGKYWALGMSSSFACWQSQTRFWSSLKRLSTAVVSSCRIFWCGSEQSRVCCARPPTVQQSSCPEDSLGSWTTRPKQSVPSSLLFPRGLSSACSRELTWLRDGPGEHQGREGLLLWLGTSCCSNSTTLSSKLTALQPLKALSVEEKIESSYFSSHGDSFWHLDASKVHE